MTNTSPAGFRRKRFVLVAAVVLAALAAVAWLRLQSSAPQEAPLRLYGNVDIREVQLAFRQPGRLAEMAFEEGDPVRAGVRMAALDRKPYEDALAAADAAVRVAQAELSKLRRGLRPQEITQAREALNKALAAAGEAERNFQRQTGLLASGASSQRTTASPTRSGRCPRRRWWPVTSSRSTPSSGSPAATIGWSSAALTTAPSPSSTWWAECSSWLKVATKPTP